MTEEDNTELGAVEENLLAEATRLHAETWGGYLRKGKTSSVEDILHLSNFLPQLRKQLNCCVCSGILSHVPMVSKSSCQHAVCKKCLTDDMKMQICTKDIPCVEYEESKCLSLFVQTYTLFCLTILRSKESRDHIQSADNEPGFNGIQLVGLLREGALKQQRLNGPFPNSEVIDTFQLPPPPSPEPFSIPIESESATCGDDDVEDEEEESGTEEGVVLLTSFNNEITEGNNEHFYPPMVPNTDQWPDPSRILQYGSGVESIVKLEGSPPETAGFVGSVARAVEGTQGSGEKLKIRLPKQPKSRKGCRCGTAAVAPGRKLTCCGQRCPCYVEKRACYECRCKGCRNPHTYDGGKKFLPGPGLNLIEMEKPAINSLGTTTQVHVNGAGIFHNYSDHGAQFFPLGLGVAVGSVGSAASLDGYLTSQPIINNCPTQ